jgi:hypothetical protein
MKVVTFFASFVFSVLAILPKDSILRLLLNESSPHLTQIDSIPTKIFNKMSDIVDEEILFANFGADFNASDVIDTENLPFRRLVFSICSANRKEWLIYYEKGGRSHTTFLTYAKLDNKNEVECIFNLSPNSKELLLEKQKLIEALRNDDFIVIYDNGKPLRRNYMGF